MWFRRTFFTTPPRRRALGLEALEDRCLLSASSILPAAHHAPDALPTFIQMRETAVPIVGAISGVMSQERHAFEIPSFRGEEDRDGSATPSPALRTFGWNSPAIAVQPGVRTASPPEEKEVPRAVFAIGQSLVSAWVKLGPEPIEKFAAPLGDFGLNPMNGSEDLYRKSAVLSSWDRVLASENRPANPLGLLDGTTWTLTRFVPSTFVAEVRLSPVTPEMVIGAVRELPVSVRVALPATGVGLVRSFTVARAPARPAEEPAAPLWSAAYAPVRLVGVPVPVAEISSPPPGNLPGSQDASLGAAIVNRGQPPLVYVDSLSQVPTARAGVTFGLSSGTYGPVSGAAPLPVPDSPRGSAATQADDVEPVPAPARIEFNEVARTSKAPGEAAAAPFVPQVAGLLPDVFAADVAAVQEGLQTFLEEMGSVTQQVLPDAARGQAVGWLLASFVASALAVEVTRRRLRAPALELALQADARSTWTFNIPKADPDTW